MIDPSATALALLVAAGCTLAASGVPGLLLSWRSPWGPRIATLLTVVASVLGAGGSVLSLTTLQGSAVSIPSAIPGARVLLAVDPLSGAFALPAFVVGALGSIYG